MHAAVDNLPELTGDEKAIESSRWFKAPRWMVWEAFADPKQVVQWWGPHGFTATIAEMELHAGGKWRMVMHGPDGTDYPGEMTFLEVTPGEQVRLEMVGGKEGGPPVRFTISIAWTEEKGGTRLDWRIKYASREQRDENVRAYGAVQGLRDLFERLETLLEKRLQ